MENSPWYVRTYVILFMYVRMYVCMYVCNDSNSSKSDNNKNT